MSLKIALELSDKDLRYFRKKMNQARKAARGLSEDEIIKGASELLESLRGGEISDFIRNRLHTLETMIEMLHDGDWNLSGSNRSNIVRALAYFAEAEDLIPDRIPGLGYLDDAIMIELVARELEHDLQAYDDFCTFRKLEARRRGRKAAEDREAWLGPRRKQLQARMMRRRERRRRSQRSGGGRSPIALW